MGVFFQFVSTPFKANQKKYLPDTRDTNPYKIIAFGPGDGREAVVRALLEAGMPRSDASMRFTEPRAESSRQPTIGCPSVVIFGVNGLPCRFWLHVEKGMHSAASL